MITPETTDDILAEIPRAIRELTKEVKQLRLLLADVIDPTSGEKFPGVIRVRQHAD